MKKSITVILSLFISISACAGTLSIPKEFEFIALNGNEVENSLFSKKTRLTVAPGAHKIALLYKNTVRDDIGNGSTRVISEPIIISLVAEEGENYQISSRYKIKSLSDAKAFIKDPQINVKNEQGDLASYTMHQAKIDSRGVLGNMIKKKEDNLQTIALLETAIKRDDDKETTPQKMLHHWWEQADAETQKEFISWAVKQID
ncbi:MAG: hypothetical protein ACJAT7_000014 [Psychromonas sp.]|jgi:uncharacterized protein YccT (UPF0319 family)|uniref:YccT family protein n=1 Tax=Psychromonas sp. TaxID=1884585 RepID=UPI0039E5F747